MTQAGPSGRGPSKNERRDAAREKARQQREQQRRRERRRRVILQASIGVAIVAVVVIVAIVLVNSVRPPGPGPKNMADGGIIVGTGLKAQTSGAAAADATPAQRSVQKGVIAIRAYEDFQCPNCKDFEDTNAAYIKSLVQAGTATLQIYPVAILDRESSTNYSTRSANAADCVANFSPNQFYEFHRLLYANQPAENSAGLTDAQLTGYAEQAKVSNLAQVTSCISQQTYKSFVGAVTDRFSQPDLPLSDVKGRSNASQTNYIGTPTVLINGTWYKGSITDPSAFKAAVLKSQAFTPTPTPTPTPSATPSLDSESPSPSASKK